MFKVLFAYYGWQNANYVLNDIKNPVRTLKIAGPLGLGITATLYIFANLAYFAYVSYTYDLRTFLEYFPPQRVFENRHFGVWHNSCFAVLRERVWHTSAAGAHDICCVKVHRLPPKTTANLILNCITAR